MRFPASAAARRPHFATRLKGSRPQRRVPAQTTFYCGHRYPVAHASRLLGTTLIPFDMFGRSWVTFREAVRQSPGRGIPLHNVLFIAAERESSFPCNS